MADASRSRCDGEVGRLGARAKWRLKTAACDGDAGRFGACAKMACASHFRRDGGSRSGCSRACTKLTISCAGIVYDTTKRIKTGNNSVRFRFEWDIIGTMKSTIESTSLFLHNLSSFSYRAGIGKAWATLGARWLGLQCANVKKAAGKARCSSQPLGRVVAFRGGDPCPFPALLCLRRCTRCPRWRTRSLGRSARCRRPGCWSLEGLAALRAFLGAHVIAHIVALHANPRAHRR